MLRENSLLSLSPRQQRPLAQHSTGGGPFECIQGLGAKSDGNSLRCFHMHQRQGPHASYKGNHPTSHASSQPITQHPADFNALATPEAHDLPSPLALPRFRSRPGNKLLCLVSVTSEAAHLPLPTPFNVGLDCRERGRAEGEHGEERHGRNR